MYTLGVLKVPPSPNLFSISISWTERSALRALWEKLFVHKSDLMNAFREFDPSNTGTKKSKQTHAVAMQRSNSHPVLDVIYS